MLLKVCKADAKMKSCLGLPECILGRAKSHYEKSLESFLSHTQRVVLMERRSYYRLFGLARFVRASRCFWIQGKSP